MEADWSVALGADDPAIAVPWKAPGDEAGRNKFVDLRLGGHLVDEIEEARTKPALHSALLRLNGASSPLWTAKCDAWNGDEAVDPYEMDAEPGETAFSAGSYIDLMPRNVTFQASFERQERWIRVVTGALRAIPAKAARVDLILRHAEIDAVPGFAVSWFVAGCGANAQRAEQAWNTALDLALLVIMDAALMSCNAAAVDGTMTKRASSSIG